MAAAGFALVSLLGAFQSARADIRYVPTTAIKLRADSLRTARPLMTIAAGAELTPLDVHSDFTGMYRVATARGDTGWVAGEYLLEAEPTPAHRTRLFALRSSSTCPKPVSRGAVKDLTDKDVGAIVRTPSPATIAHLRALPAPALRPLANRSKNVAPSGVRRGLPG